MSKINDLVRVGSRAVAVLMLAAVVAASVSSLENATASELASAPDTGVSSFSGYMVAVG